MPKVLTLTPEQLKAIAESKLIGKIIAETYGISIKTVYKIKKKAGTAVGIGRNTAHEGKITTEQKLELLESSLEIEELSVKYNLSIGYIYRLFRDNKIERKRVKPVKEKRVRAPKPKKEKPVKLPVLKVKNAVIKNTEDREKKRAEEHEKRLEAFRQKEIEKASWPWIYCKETRSYTRKKPELKTA